MLLSAYADPGAETRQLGSGIPVALHHRTRGTQVSANWLLRFEAGAVAGIETGGEGAVTMGAAGGAIAMDPADGSVNSELFQSETCRTAREGALVQPAKTQGPASMTSKPRRGNNTSAFCASRAETQALKFPRSGNESHAGRF